MKKTVIRRKAVILFAAFALAVNTYAQKMSPSPQDLYTEAYEYILAGDYQEALPVLLNLEEKGHTGANISFKIGECYLNGKGQKTRAIPYFRVACQKMSASYSGTLLDEGVAPLKSLLYLGIAYRLNYEFDRALTCFESYRDSLSEKDTDNRAIAGFHIDRCLNARELMAAPARLICDTLPATVNTVYSNFNPLVTADEKQLYYMDQRKFYDAVMHSARPDSIWQDPENLTPAVRSDGDHLLTGLSADGTVLFLSAYDPYFSGEIFMAELKDGKWGEMKKLNGNINTRFNETHASLSPDGKTLYFTSDRQGGYGGLDIYKSERTEQGDWGPAQNLGPQINTPFNEESPFVSGDGKTLFFSSQGHYNMGGYDIFMCTADGSGHWLPPVNAGYPINTTDDDLFFFPLGSGRIAYTSRFSTNSTQADIVRYNILSFGNPARFTVTGKVNLIGDALADASQISLAVVNNSGRDTLSRQNLKQDGSFSKKLPGGSYTLSFSGNDSVLLRKQVDIPVYLPQDILVINPDIHTGNRKMHVDSVLVKDIRFEFDRGVPGDLWLQYIDELARLLATYPDIRLDIKGFADSRGSDAYNMRLSLARAGAVAGYINKKGSFASRITVHAFGEKNPVALNTTADGRDNPDGRVYNRRVELVFSNLPASLKIIRQSDIPLNLRVK
jgi:outer membrane protein OmpA-like peptidoglycan-associated protein